jgi:uncharacterized protein YcgI (DUF1989 family)
VILSDMGRVAFSLIEDTSGAHDLMVGGSTPASTLAASGAAGATRRRISWPAAKIGLGVRDISPCITFFAPVSLDAGPLLWKEGRKRPGDFVDLRAEMNLIVAASNCAHPLNPSQSGGRRRHADQASRAGSKPGRPVPNRLARGHARFRLYGPAVRLKENCRMTDSVIPDLTYAFDSPPSGRGRAC